MREVGLVSAPKRSREVPQWRLLGRKVIPTPQAVMKVRREIEEELMKKEEDRKKALVPVFNPNPHRHQLPLAPKHPLMLLLMDALAQDGALRKREMGKSVALYSSKGCEQQPWHIDFDPRCKKQKLGELEEPEQQRELQRDLRDRDKPQGVFWAVQEGCRLMVVGSEGESVEVHLELGDVLIFDGDLVHAGAAYPERDNLRVHVYLYVKEVAKPSGSTYKVPAFRPVSKVHCYSRGGSLYMYDA